MNNLRWSLLLACLLSVIAAGCTITNKFGVYRGQILDAETLEPLAGVVVYMECYTARPTLGGDVHQVAGVKEVLTDANGEFEIELRITAFKILALWERYPRFIIFKPGYGVFPRHKRSKVRPHTKRSSSIFPVGAYVTIVLPKLTTTKERINNLRSIYVGPDVPRSKWPELSYLIATERIQVGLRPHEKYKRR